MLCCTLSYTAVHGQNIEIEYPYNPDFENDGHVGVEDVLQLLSVFESDFQPEGLLVNDVPFQVWAEAVADSLVSQTLQIDSLFSMLGTSPDSLWLEFVNDTLFLMPYGSFVELVNEPQITDSDDFNGSVSYEDFQISNLLPSSCVDWVFRNADAPVVFKVIGVLDGKIYYLTNELQLVRVSGDSDWEYVSQHVFGQFTEGFSNSVIGSSLNPGRFFIGISGSHIVAFGCPSCSSDNGCWTNEVYIHEVETGVSSFQSLATSFHFRCSSSNSLGTGHYSEFRYPWIRPFPQLTSYPNYETKIINIEDFNVVSTIFNGSLQEDYLLGSNEALGAYAFSLTENTLYEIPGGLEGWSVLRNDTLSRIALPVQGNLSVFSVDSYVVPTLNEVSSMELVSLSAVSPALSKEIWWDKIVMKAGQYFMDDQLMTVPQDLVFSVSPVYGTNRSDCLLHNYVLGRNQDEFFGEYPLTDGEMYASGVGNLWFTFSE